MTYHKGTVLWFEKSIGEGIIRDNESQITHRVYACNIVGAKTGYPHTACMYLENGQQVEFALTGDPYIDGPCGAGNITNGIFDAEHWDRIKGEKLAFRKNDNGEFINGLFE